MYMISVSVSSMYRTENFQPVGLPVSDVMDGTGLLCGQQKQILRLSVVLIVNSCVSFQPMSYSRKNRCRSAMQRRLFIAAVFGADFFTVCHGLYKRPS